MNARLRLSVYLIVFERKFLKKSGLPSCSIISFLILEKPQNLVSYEQKKSSTFMSLANYGAGAISPVSVVLIGWESLTPPGRWRWYSFTYSVKIRSWVSSGEKEGRTNIQISAKTRIEPRTLWSESRDDRDLYNDNHSRPPEKILVVLISQQLWTLIFLDQSMFHTNSIVLVLEVTEEKVT